jgi:hypothetical protein
MRWETRLSVSQGSEVKNRFNRFSFWRDRPNDRRANHFNRFPIHTRSTNPVLAFLVRRTSFRFRSSNKIWRRSEQDVRDIFRDGEAIGSEDSESRTLRRGPTVAAESGRKFLSLIILSSIAFNFLEMETRFSQ